MLSVQYSAVLQSKPSAMAAAALTGVLPVLSWSTSDVGGPGVRHLLRDRYGREEQQSAQKKGSVCTSVWPQPAQAPSDPHHWVWCPFEHLA